MEINKTYNEDCLQTMSRMPDKFVNLIVTSPPYNFDAGSGLGNKYNGKRDRMTQDDYFEWSKKVIDEALRISKLVCYNIQMIAGNKTALMKLIGNYAEQMREIIIWDKKYSEPAMNEKVLNSEWEFILLMSEQGGGRKIDEAEFERGTVSNILRVNKNKGSGENHSACFPNAIPDRLINYFSKEGELIYDPFMGLGTTAISAIKYKRNFIGSEISDEYCKIAEKRIAPYLNQTVLNL